MQGHQIEKKNVITIGVIYSSSPLRFLQKSERIISEILMEWEFFSTKSPPVLYTTKSMMNILHTLHNDDILKRTFIFHRVQIPIKTKLGHFNET